MVTVRLKADGTRHNETAGNFNSLALRKRNGRDVSMWCNQKKQSVANIIRFFRADGLCLVRIPAPQRNRGAATASRQHLPDRNTSITGRSPSSFQDSPRANPSLAHPLKRFAMWQRSGHASAKACPPKAPCVEGLADITATKAPATARLCNLARLVAALPDISEQSSDGSEPKSSTRRRYQR